MSCLAAGDRSFVGTSPDKDLTETEVEEVVEAHLRADGLESLWDRMSALAELDDDRRLNMFHLVSWDSVTGDGAEFPGRFEDFFGALK